jgi:Mg-chelatase subunit ChlD
MALVLHRPFALALLLAAGLLGPVPALADAVPAPRPAPPEPPVAESLANVTPWLESKDWTVRSIAAYGLRRRTEPGVVVLCARALARETDPLVEGMLLGALQGRPRIDLVSEGGVTLAEALVGRLEHRHPLLRERAHALLTRMPPVPLGDKPEILKGWWARGREALAEEQAFLLKQPRAPAAGGAPAAPGETKTVAPVDPDVYSWVEGLQRDGLELVVVMDSTGSMGAVIAAAKAQCQALVRRLRFLVPQFRAGLVTYDDGARLRAPLTVDEAELQKAFDKVAAAGGGDIEEGVDKGIYLALKQEQVAWSRKAHRVIVVVGDAPPHDGDVAPLLKRLAKSADDEMFEHPVSVHCVATSSEGVEHFRAIAGAGRGAYITLGTTDRLADALVLLTFGNKYRTLAEAWLEEVDKLRATAPPPAPGAGGNR